jgi:hypothetical protein
MPFTYGKDIHDSVARIKDRLPLTAAFFSECFEKSPELDNCTDSEEFYLILTRHVNHHNIRGVREEIKRVMAVTPETEVNEISALLSALSM